MRLVGDLESPHLITINTKLDHTERMLSWCSEKVRELEDLDLYGFIFKKGSPSSGMERVKVYNDRGMPSNRESACLPVPSWSISPSCLLKKTGGSMILISGKTS